VTLYATVMDTPPAPLSLVADGDGLVAAGFVADPTEMHARLPAALRRRALQRIGDLGGLSKGIAAYFEGDLSALEGVVVAPSGTPGQRRLWDALREVPAGQTRTYAQLAAAAGNAAASRAAGSACARNLIAPVIPCHRIVRTDGGLGGYAYGLAVKQWLLTHERRHTA
jgi:methylated-DNA-[protein]-cysteine S-methyltransferase